MYKKLIVFLLLGSIGTVKGVNPKLNSDREVVKALSRLAGIEAGSWPEYQNVVKVVLGMLLDSAQFSAEEKKIKALASLLKDINTSGSLLNFFKTSGIKAKPGAKMEDYLPEFYESKQVTVSNERLKNVMVNIFTEPAEKFNVIKNQLTELLSPLFYNVDNPENWQFVLPKNELFKEEGARRFDKDALLTRILLNALVAQRPVLRNPTEDQKNTSDAILYYLLDSKRNQQREIAFPRLVTELDWLRINPAFLKFDGMLCSLPEKSVVCAPSALLTFVSDPMKVMKLPPEQKYITEQRLLAPLNACYFGGNIKTDFAVDRYTEESAFAPIKFMMVTQILDKYFK